MGKLKTSLTALAVVVALSACSEQKTTSAPSAESENASSTSQAGENNVLLQAFKGPYGGVPAFDKMSLSDLEPAFEKAMAINLKEIEAIANNPAPPTFENVIVALEKAGAELSRVYTYYGIWRSNKSSPEFREIQGKLSPKLSAFSTKIIQNEKLFARVKAVYESDEMKQLTPEEQRVTWMRYNRFARNGATLDGEAKKRYAEINQELATLHTQFSNNVLADEENYVTYITEDQLDGLPASFVTAAKAAADARGESGKYAITNTVLLWIHSSLTLLTES